MSFPHPILQVGRPVIAMLLASSPALRADPDDLNHSTTQLLDTGGRGAGQLNTIAPAPVVFGVIGDYGTGSEAEQQVADMIAGWGPDFIVTAGDNNYGSLVPEPAFFDPPRTDWSRYVGGYYGAFIKGRGDELYPEQTSPGQRFFPAVGNHDSSPPENEFAYGGAIGGTIRGYLAYFHDNPGGLARLPTDRGAVHTIDVSYYATRKGAVDLFILDADAVHVPDLIAPQQQWLLERIAESSAPWKIAVFHEPPYTSSFRGGVPWMEWPELNQVSAILCGHDHFYERIDYSEGGPPLFVNGAGGAGLYGFTTPVERSRFRFNEANGALRIVADDVGMAFEFRVPSRNTGAEDLIERFTLGAPIENDPSDDFRLFVEAGVTLQVSSFTPSPGEQPPLDPALELYGPNHTLLAEAAGGAPDGRNVRLSRLIDFTGWHRIRVKAEERGAGAYEIEAELDHPHGGYAQWCAAQFPGVECPDPLADPDADGLANILEYASGLDPKSAENLPRDVVSATFLDPFRFCINFEVPSPAPLDLRYFLEMSVDLNAGGWILIAESPAFRDWTSLALLESEQLENQRRRITVEVPVLDGDTRRFFRLRVVHHDNA